MMCDTKFRAWDKIDKEMFDVLCIDWMDKFVVKAVPILVPAGDDADIDWDFEQRKFDDIELMQFTGLHDKNGQEIWEGDIVRLKKSKWPAYQNTQAYAELFWWQYHAAFYYKEFTKPRHPRGEIISNGSDYQMEELEVIGNIHQNPELLRSE